MRETIFAVATAPGRSGIAIIRLSGPSIDRALAALSCALPPPRVARRARFVAAATGEALDDGLILYFPGPASVTGEDVAELHLHGSRAILEAVLGVLAALPGLRLAEPGEFTRRAFEHGKLDLTEAEAVADLVAAETDAQRRQALRQLAGELGRLYEGWRERLTRALALVEAAIDFSEEGLPERIEASAQRDIQGLVEEIRGHLADGRRGEMLRDGVSIAIVGPPNVGKSSLLNALARRDVAITAPSAGTTRDILEVRLDLAGYPVILADTAGLREAEDAIEAEGIRRALARTEAADLVLLVLDIRNPAEAVAFGQPYDRASLIVANKADLGGSVPAGLGPAPVLAVSAATGAGMPELLDALTKAVKERLSAGGGPVLTRARHRAALEAVAAALGRSLAADAVELAAEDLRLAIRELGRITGRVDVEDILDVIFREFCIGK